jgi:chromodomain-helicase-DNA-binding protein 1
MVGSIINLRRITANYDRAYTINNHWPRAGVTVTAIKGMYNKMLNNELKPAAGSAHTNGSGQKNGA